MLVNPCFELRIVFQPPRLKLQQVFSLLHHSLGIAEPVEEVFLVEKPSRFPHLVVMRWIHHAPEFREGDSRQWWEVG